MKQGSDWIGRRWYEFRTGYQTYMVFLFGFSNFILILYNFAPQFKELTSLEIFAVLVLGAVIPLGVIIGRIHNRKQIPTESKIQVTHHHYKDRIVPESKETLAQRATIFNQKHALWQNEFSQWQLNLAKKQYAMTNAIMDHFKINPELRYTDEDLKKLAEYDVDLKRWGDGLNAWKDKHEKFLQGELASTLTGDDETPEDDQVTPEVHDETVEEKKPVEGNPDLDMLRNAFAKKPVVATPTTKKPTKLPDLPDFFKNQIKESQITKADEPKKFFDRDHIDKLKEHKVKPDDLQDTLNPKPDDIVGKLQEHKKEQSKNRFKKQLSISLNKKSKPKNDGKGKGKGLSFSGMKKAMNKPLFPKKPKPVKSDDPDDEELLPP